MTIKIQTTKSNRIRAMQRCNPSMTERDIAAAMSLRVAEVRNALSKGDRRRLKTVAR
jgi:putative heme degradation protein